MLRARLAGLLATLLTLIGLSAPAAALTDQEQLVERARLAVTSMMSSEDYPALAAYLRHARAALIVPELYKGGFIIGAEGGYGVLMVHYEGGGWSYPVFMSVAGGSVGLQIGGQVSELVLAVMTEEGLQSIFNRSATFGADANIAVIGMGAGLEARTGLYANADMYAFARNQGLFAGGALEGSVLTTMDEWNFRYYGQGALPNAILNGQVGNPHADMLRAAMPN